MPNKVLYDLQLPWFVNMEHFFASDGMPYSSFTVRTGYHLSGIFRLEAVHGIQGWRREQQEKRDRLGFLWADNDW